MPDAKREFRFVLLGAPPRAKAWYAAIEASARHHIVAALKMESSTTSGPQHPGCSKAAGVLDRDRESVEDHFLVGDTGNVPVYDRWEPIAEDDSIDAAILFSPGAELCDAARQLASRGKGLIIDWECRLPSSLVAELGLLDAEETAVVVPVFDWRAFPVLHELWQIVASGRLGDIRVVRIESDFSSEAGTKDGLLNDDLLQSTLVRDIDTLRWIGGDYSQVTVLRTGVTSEGFAEQTLNLTGQGLPDATCVYRVGDAIRWLCEVQGSAGSASARFDQHGHRLVVDGETVLTQDVPEPDPALCLRLLDDALARKPGSLRWQDRMRVHEIQDAMQRSLRRRRTIDLQFETTSERSQFKTQMATAGCFVLMYTFLATVLLLLAGAVLDTRDQLQREAEAAGFVVTRDEFEPLTGRLTPDGERHLLEIAGRWQLARAVVVVESTGDEELDRMKLANVRKQLEGNGVQRAEERSIVRPLAGRGFQRLMAAGRVLAFAPLGVLLLLQLLLFISRPPRERQA